MLNPAVNLTMAGAPRRALHLLGLLAAVWALAPSAAHAGEPVVRAPAPPAFPHAAHAATPCATCHAAAAQATAPGEAGPVPATACAGCHPDGRRPALRAVASPWALHFSHSAHAQRGLECGHCHPGAAAAQKPDCLRCHQAHLADRPPAPSPDLSACDQPADGGDPVGAGPRACPDPVRASAAAQARAATGGRPYPEPAPAIEPPGLSARPGPGPGARPGQNPATPPTWPTRAAPAACATCHPTGPDGRLRTAWPRGRLRPTDPAQDHRDPAWLRAAHADAARAAPATCDTCHAPPDCAGCHVGRDRPAEIHPADYILSHPAEARRNAPSCDTCHRQQTFCRGCHAQSGVVFGTDPLSFGRATPGRRDFHPPGFGGAAGTVPGPEHHRHTARRSLGTCVSCHAEQDCVGCHSAQAAPALRASPHPPGVARRLCDRAHGAAPSGCLKCHRDPAELDRLCGP